MSARPERASSDGISNAACDAFDPRVLCLVSAVLDPITQAYFRFQLRGAENIPSSKCLIVGNHSGLGIVDVACLLGAWPRKMGLQRRVVGLMADSFVKAPLAGRLFRAFGSMPASQKNADDAFERGHDVLVYPGGELDACRPFYQPRLVEFGNRRGYIRLALRHGVPVVPLATIGSHWTLPMLPGGYWAARLIGTRRRLRNDRFPIVLTWVVGLCGLALGLLGLIPWWASVLSFLFGISFLPARVSSELLPPIDIAGLTAHIEDEDERVEAAHRIVHGALQRAVLEMQHDVSGFTTTACQVSTVG